jgi:hypothetical protein
MRIAATALGLAMLGAAGQSWGKAAEAVTLAADDLHIFAELPPGFADPRPGVAPGRVEPFSYS